MKKLFVVAGTLATLILGAGAGVVVAQGTANPSSDVLYASTPANPSTPPSSYAEGVTIQEINIQFSPGCNGYGIVTTTRLGDLIVQDAVLTESFEPGVSEPGDHCSRSGDATASFWAQFRPNTN